MPPLVVLNLHNDNSSACAAQVSQPDIQFKTLFFFFLLLLHRRFRSRGVIHRIGPSEFTNRLPGVLRVISHQVVVTVRLQTTRPDSAGQVLLLQSILLPTAQQQLVVRVVLLRLSITQRPMHHHLPVLIGDQ